MLEGLAAPLSGAPRAPPAAWAWLWGTDVRHDIARSDAHTFDPAPLTRTIAAVLRGERAPLALQAVFRGVCDACARDPAPVLAAAHARLRHCVEEVVDAFPRGVSDAAYAAHVYTAWRALADRLAAVAELLSPAEPRGDAVEAAAFAHWQQQLRTARADGTLVRGIVAQADALRRAGIAGGATDGAAGALRGALAHTARLGLAERVSDALAQHALDFYAAHAQRVFGAHDAPPDAVEIPRLRAALEHEDAWAAWMYPAAHEAVPAQLRDVLLTQHAAALAAAAPPLLAPRAAPSAQPTEPPPALHALYALLATVGALDALRRAVCAYAADALAAARADAHPIERLLAIHTALRSAWASCFDSDEALHHALRATLEDGVNACGAVAERLAAHVDAALRRSPHTATEALALFRFVHDKDVFAACFQRGLAQRLLERTSASAAAEHAVLAQLRHECGPDYTADLDAMLRDMHASDELSAAFAREHPPCALDVRVLAQTHWPVASAAADVALPPALQDTLVRFASFYAARHAGRSLQWQHALGSLVLRADLGRAGVKELHVDTFQAAVLFAFDSAPRAARLSYAELAEHTRLPPAVLQRTLQSLACGAPPTRVLRKYPTGPDVCAGDAFTLNEALRSDRAHLRLFQWAACDVRGEQRAAARVHLSRDMVLQAAAVRVLKAHGEMQHADLAAQVAQQTQHRFAMRADELREAVDSLIEKVRRSGLTNAGLCRARRRGRLPLCPIGRCIGPLPHEVPQHVKRIAVGLQLDAPGERRIAPRRRVARPVRRGERHGTQEPRPRHAHDAHALAGLAKRDLFVRVQPRRAVRLDKRRKVPRGRLKHTQRVLERREDRSGARLVGERRACHRRRARHRPRVRAVHAAPHDRHKLPLKKRPHKDATDLDMMRAAARHRARRVRRHACIHVVRPLDPQAPTQRGALRAQPVDDRERREVLQEHGLGARRRRQRHERRTLYTSARRDPRVRAASPPRHLVRRKGRGAQRARPAQHRVVLEKRLRAAHHLAVQDEITQHRRAARPAPRPRRRTHVAQRRKVALQRKAGRRGMRRAGRDERKRRWLRTRQRAERRAIACVDDGKHRAPIREPPAARIADPRRARGQRTTEALERRSLRRCDDNRRQRRLAARVPHIRTELVPQPRRERRRVQARRADQQRLPRAARGNDDRRAAVAVRRERRPLRLGSKGHRIIHHTNVAPAHTEHGSAWLPRARAIPHGEALRAVGARAAQVRSAAPKRKQGAAPRYVCTEALRRRTPDIRATQRRHIAAHAAVTARRQHNQPRRVLPRIVRKRPDTR